MKYFILYLPYHDYSLLDRRVFDTLEAAKDAVMTKAHDHYEYESVNIYELQSSTLSNVACYAIRSDNLAYETPPDEWDLICKE